jgi:hypothetical protein
MTDRTSMPSIWIAGEGRGGRGQGLPGGREGGAPLLPLSRSPPCLPPRPARPIPRLIPASAL